MQSRGLDSWGSSFLLPCSIPPLPCVSQEPIEFPCNSSGVCQDAGTQWRRGKNPGKRSLGTGREFQIGLLQSAFFLYRRHTIRANPGNGPYQRKVLAEYINNNNMAYGVWQPVISQTSTVTSPSSSSKWRQVSPILGSIRSEGMVFSTDFTDTCF